MMKKCEFCEKDFEVGKSEFKRRKTCSKECMYKLRTKNQTINVFCKICSKPITCSKSKLKKSKSGNMFCSNKCVGIYNKEENKKTAILKSCEICQKQFSTIKAREETSLTCSNKCQGEWQSLNRIGEKSSNWRGGGGFKVCEQCKKTYKTKSPSVHLKQKFCSKECKNYFWKENTLHKSESFKSAHYEGMLNFRNTRKETAPERLIREYLESKGLVKDKDFYQEQGFFRKYYADFYIPKTKTVIEAFGDFWHANPEIYGEGLAYLYKNQIEQIEKDKQRKIDFLNSNFNYYELWESDINKNLEELMSNIKVK